jgi:hypothetical protein
MRLPVGFVRRSGKRLGRVLSGALAKQRKGRLGRTAAGLLAKQRRGRLGRAVAGLLAKHRRERIGQGVVVALIVLLGSGTVGALALLPPVPPGTSGERGVAAGAAASRIAVGQLVAPRPKPRRGGPAYYRKTASRRVSASAAPAFLPLYREAARTFGVSWRLLASIHRQETAFSTVPGTYHGLNAFGCCAGPMQFNVKNGPPSTWALYRDSFRLGDRPRRYPHPTRKHPSIYDDFDAIMAAGALLRDSGATEALDGWSWTAAYAYYGHDLFGVDYASQVMGRARGWERDGFCLNCSLDETLVAAFDDAYGVDARRQLRIAERLDKQKKHKKRKKRDRGGESRKAREKAKAPEAPPRAPARDGARPEPPAAQTPTQTQTTPNTTTTTTPMPAAPEATPPAPPPSQGSCSLLQRLVGCRG